MTQAVLLHTIQDADHYLQNELFSGARLFSANVNVVYYLKYQYKQECGDICAYLEPEEARKINENTLQTSNDLLCELDERVAPLLNEQLGFSMNYFTPLYSFIGARQLALYELLALALRRMLEADQVDSVVLYEGELGPLKSPVVDFFKTVFPYVKCYTISYKEPATMNQTVISGIRLERLAGLLFSDDAGFLTFQEAVTRQPGTTGENILLFGPVDKLGVLDRDFAADGIYYFQPLPEVLKDLFQYRLSSRALPEQETISAIRAVSLEERPLLILLYDAIREDFGHNIVQYLHVYTLYRKLHEADPIQQAYWENPPVQGAGALVLEYFMTNEQTKVAGIQSRATFFVGKIDAPYAAVSVFSRCQQFLNSECMGEVKLVDVKRSSSCKRQAVDVAIFFKPTMSFLKTGQVVNTGKIQEALLCFLELQQKKEIHIITHVLPALVDCAMLSLLKQLQNVRWINDADVESYLAKNAPKLFIFDSLTPLISEMLAEELNVVIIKDPMLIFCDETLTLLKRKGSFVDSANIVKTLLQSI